MPFFVFGQGKPPSREWELLGTTSRRDVADEVYDNYCRLASEQAAPRIVIVEAATAADAKAEIEAENLSPQTPLLEWVGQKSPPRLGAAQRKKPA